MTENRGYQRNKFLIIFMTQILQVFVKKILCLIISHQKILFKSENYCTKKNYYMFLKQSLELEPELINLQDMIELGLNIVKFLNKML